MKQMLLTSLCMLSLIVSSSVSQPNSLNTTFWEGNWWSGNINMGVWFPSFDTLAIFGIDDFSVGQIRTRNPVPNGDSIRITAQIFLNSGGINGDGAFFGLGEWETYSSAYGIKFRNGEVRIMADGQTLGATIGTYVVGEPTTFTLIHNSGGSITIRGSRFSGTIIPQIVPTTKRWIIAQGNSLAYQGMQIKSISPSRYTLNTSNWEGQWWSGNINMGVWFPSIEVFANFSIDDYSVGQVRTLAASSGDSIVIVSQMILNSGGVNGDGAFFGLGEWETYGNAYGIKFLNGEVKKMEDGQTLGTIIGTYVVGEMVTFTLKHNAGGSITVRGSRFSGTVTPQVTPTTRRWIIAQGNSAPSQGVFVKSVNPRPLAVRQNQSNLPERFLLLQNYPNPFNPSTTIEYHLPSRGTVQVNIYNSLGQLVRSLVNEPRDAGTHSVVWDGRDNGGNAVATGVYFYQVQVGGFAQAKRMLLLK